MIPNSNVGKFLMEKNLYIFVTELNLQVSISMCLSKNAIGNEDEVEVCEAMYAFFHSNFAAYIVCRCYERYEFLGVVWTITVLGLLIQ